ncbi:MAG: hypothetical protein LC797_08530 [Chloroflexi bacterium]|nr:hypothetical protein [Chloroflexota bacterium]
MKVQKLNRPVLSVLGVSLALGVLAVWAYSSAVASPLDDKALIEQRYQKDKLVVPHVIADPAKERPTTIVTNPPAPTGIIEEIVAPFPAADFLATNRWQGIIGGQLVAVIAGGRPNTALGQLAVLTFDKEGTNVVETRRFELPGAPGRARVASASGSIILIQTDSGKRFTIDASTKVITALP